MRFSCAIAIGVSSRQPSDIPEFNKNLIELLSEAKQKTPRAA
jgi:hypothetical protein